MSRREFCMQLKDNLKKIVRNKLKNLFDEHAFLLRRTNTVKAKDNENNPIEIVESFLMLELFREELKHFNLIVELENSEGRRIEVDSEISYFQNKFKDFFKKHSTKISEYILNREASERRSEYKKYINANMLLCRKLLDLSKYEFV